MRKLVAVAIAAALVGFGLVAVFVSILGGGNAAQVAAPTTTCATAPTVTLTAANLSAVQLGNAAEIVTVGKATAGVGTEGEIAALAGALVESNLRVLANSNVPSSLSYPYDGVGSDHDSLGLLQARPSQGWGTVAQLMTAQYDATVFYQRLVKEPGWSKVSAKTSASTIGAFVQLVQGSAFPLRYAEQVPLAFQLVNSASPISTVSDPTSTCTAATVALPTGTGLPASVVAGIARAPVQVQQAIAYALSKLGDNYVWGAIGPTTFDCSGLVMSAYAAAGVSIPRTSQAQSADTSLPSESLASVEPGDLVFPFADESHVVMALGGGWMIEAPHTGVVVRVGKLYGAAGGIRRVVQPTATVVDVPSGPSGTGTPLGCPANSEIVSGGAPAIQPDRNYCFAAGTYGGFSVAPQSGDGFYGGGHAVLQGDGAGSAFITGNVSNLVIDGFTMEGYFDCAGGGCDAVPGVIDFQTGSNVTISDNTITNDESSAVSWGSKLGIPCCNIRNGGINDSVITHNVISNIGYSGTRIASGTDDTVSYNDVSNMNTDRVDTENDVSALGKYAVTSGMQVIGNNVHSTFSHGIWFDDYNIGGVIENNTLTGTNSSAIFWEISGGAVISGNHLTGNGMGDVGAGGNPGAGISVSSSGSSLGLPGSGTITISGNTLDGNLLGIVLFNGHPNPVSGCVVTGNSLGPGQGISDAEPGLNSVQG